MSSPSSSTHECLLCSGFLRTGSVVRGHFRPLSPAYMKTLWYVPKFPTACLLEPTPSRACLTAMQLPRCPVGADQSKRDPYHTSQKSSQSPAARVALGRVRSLVRMIKLLCASSTYELFYPVNLAFALAMRKPPSLGRRLRVGILDLDIFGPSIPTLMGLQHSDEPILTSGRPSSHCSSHPWHYSASKRRCNVAYHKPRTAHHVHGIPSSKVGREQAKRGCRRCMERFNGSESSATTAF